MKKILFLACTLMLYAGCASNQQTASSGDVGLSAEKKMEGQRAREGGLSDQWVYKEVKPGIPGMPAEPVYTPVPTAAGTSGEPVISGTGLVEVSDETEIELRKEELVIEKRPVSNGSVVIRKVVETENVSKPIELKREEYVLERIPVSPAQQGIGPGIPNAFQSREIYMPLMKEEAVAGKRTLLTEVVTVGKRIETDRQTITQPVRHDEVEIVKNPNLSDSRFAQLPHRALPAAQVPDLSGNPMPAAPADTVQLTKEELLVGKKPVENGGVYVQKVVHSEQASVPIETRREEFTIQRTPGNNQPVSGGEFAQREIQIDLSREQPVVGLRNYVTEVVKVKKQTLTDTQVVSDTIRKENIEIVKNTEKPISAAAPVGTAGISVVSGSSSSADLIPMSSGNDQTSITGKAVCTKCQLKQTSTCQNAIQVKANGKTVVYHLVDNAVTQNFHDELIGKKVTALGTVQQSGDTMQFVATKISAVK